MSQPRQLSVTERRAQAFCRDTSHTETYTCPCGETYEARGRPVYGFFDFPRPADGPLAPHMARERYFCRNDACGRGMPPSLPRAA